MQEIFEQIESTSALAEKDENGGPKKPPLKKKPNKPPRRSKKKRPSERDQNSSTPSGNPASDNQSPVSESTVSNYQSLNSSTSIEKGYDPYNKLFDL